MYKNHPFQHLYFNLLAKKDLIDNYQVDYWGLSNLFLIRYLLKTHPTNEIKVLKCVGLDISLSMLTETEKSRIRFVDKFDENTYALFTYRFGSPEEHTLWRSSKQNFLTVYNLKVDDQVVATIFKGQPASNQFSSEKAFPFGCMK